MCGCIFLFLNVVTFNKLQNYTSGKMTTMNKPLRQILISHFIWIKHTDTLTHIKTFESQFCLWGPDLVLAALQSHLYSEVGGFPTLATKQKCNRIITSQWIQRTRCLIFWWSNVTRCRDEKLHCDLLIQYVQIHVRMTTWVTTVPLDDV